MRKIVEKLKNKFSYSFESIKNRYPCKLVRVKNHNVFDKKTLVTYQAVNRFNLRDLTLESLLNDPMIVEKFHPTEAVKIGFLSAGEILLKGEKSLEEIKREYQKIVTNMFKDLDGRHEIQQ
ncbi:MAG: hypothetical protein NTU49_06840 [Gammaproteobacteria bacterium]|nr:hypothetical protein [Gammaproteobacteria bacterium]